MAEHDPDAAGAAAGGWADAAQGAFAALAAGQEGSRQGFHDGLAGALVFVDARAAQQAQQQQAPQALQQQHGPEAAQEDEDAAFEAAQAYKEHLHPITSAPADEPLTEGERTHLRRLLRASAESRAAAPPPLPTDANGADEALMLRVLDPAQWDAALLELLAMLCIDVHDPGAPAMPRVHQIASMPELMPALFRWLAPPAAPAARVAPAAVFSTTAQQACQMLSVIRLDIRSRRRLMTAGGARLVRALLPLAAAASLPDVPPHPLLDTSAALRVLSTLLYEDVKTTAAAEGRKMYSLPQSEAPHLEWHERWTTAYRPLQLSVRRAAIQQPGLLENAVRLLNTSSGKEAAALLNSLVDGPQTARLFIQTSPATVRALLSALAAFVGSPRPTPPPARSSGRRRRNRRNRGGGGAAAAAPAGHGGGDMTEAEKKAHFLADCISGLASPPNTDAFEDAAPDADDQLSSILSALRARMRREEGSELGTICPCCGELSGLAAVAEEVDRALAYLHGDYDASEGEAQAYAMAEALARMLLMR